MDDSPPLGVPEEKREQGKKKPQKLGLRYCGFNIPQKNRTCKKQKAEGRIYCPIHEIEAKLETKEEWVPCPNPPIQ
jgi:hypothetical protein